MGSRYQVGDVVEVWGKRVLAGKLVTFSRGIGIVKETRGGGPYADFTQRKLYIVQFPDGVRTCWARELRKVRGY